MRRDPLERHWRHTVIVRRYLGRTATAKKFDAPRAERCAIDDTTRLVRTATGEEKTSSTTVALPASTAYIPAGSEVTLPQKFGGRTAIVLGVQVADSGGLPAPDHQAINLE